MNFQISEPILIVGIGGVGTKLATKAKEFLNSDCLLISNDQKDLDSDLVDILIELQSESRSFWSLLIKRQSELRNSFALVANFVPTPPMPTIRIGSDI